MKTLKITLCTLLLCLLALPGLADQQHIHWDASLAPPDAHAGEGAQIVLHAKLDSGWHLYSLTQPDGGPYKTTIELTPGNALEASGDPVAPPFKTQHDKTLNIDLQLYEDTVTFGVPVKLKTGISGEQKATVSLTYQVCNDRTCLDPETLEVPVTFTVAAGAARPDHLSPVKTLPQQETPPATGQTGTPAPGNLEGGKQPPATPQNQGGLEEEAKSKGLAWFLLLAFGEGLLALLTPCVFPMIPITVSYFSKRKEGAPGQGLKDALAYCLGIIGTFTGVGLLATILFGGSAIRQFATNPIVNIGFAVLFIILAINLFGVFEIQIPSGFVNKIQAGRQRGGFAGPFLMGLAFTLTSFTCTVAFVGTLLAAAAHGDLFYPVVGMLAFSTAFALPFFLLALFPQYLAKLPKSGSWMISVKAFMGFLELAAALKFLSNADLVWQLGVLTKPIYLAIWSTIFLIAGLYLQGWLRLPHELNVTPGIPRRLLGAMTLALGMLCLVGMGGAHIRWLSPYLPTDPYPYKGQNSVATKDKTVWLSDYEAALAKAKAENKPIFINFTGVTCTNCRLMEGEFFPRPDVVKELKNYINVELYTDRVGIDDKNRELQNKLTGTEALPVYVTLTPEGQVRDKFEGAARNPEDIAKFLAILQQGHQ